MKKIIVIFALLLGSISNAFAGGIWQPAVPVTNMNIEHAKSGSSVCMINTSQGVYGFFINVDGANQMVEIASKAVASGKKIQVWQTSSSATITHVDLTGSSYSIKKVDGLSLNAN